MDFQFPQGEEFFDWRREQFPFFKNKIALTHASVSPLPAHSSQAIADYALRCSAEGQLETIHFPIYARCKERLAALLNNGAKPEEIAFAGSTSHALGLVASSFPWREGDNCVVFEGDFPANVIIWKNLTRTHGVEVRVVPFKKYMDLTPDDLAPYIDENTRLVSLSAVNFLTGYALDLKSFSDFLKPKGIRICVDAIQALGAVQPDLSGVDFVCADSHKWMLGPNGIAFLWCRADILPEMHPQILGWLAVEQRENWFKYDTTPFPTAERFEPGARNYLGVIGMEASLEVIQQVGMPTVERRVVELRDYAAQKLEAIGCELLWKPDPQIKSGNLSFRPPTDDVLGLFNELDKQFALSIRTWHDGREWIRISAHFMNHESDINALCEAIGKFVQ
jgi:cysteine desulfurase/selenocysteine lyase